MSETWGTVYQLERDKATGNDPDSLRAEIKRLRQDRGDCQMVMDGQQAQIEMLRAALQAELTFWRNQPSPYRHDERIEAIETALRH